MIEIFDLDGLLLTTGTESVRRVIEDMGPCPTLVRARLRFVDLREVDLAEAHLWEADLTDADLRGAKTRRANYKRGINLFI